MSKVILAGSNSKLLAENIGKTVNIPVLNHRIVHFINGEMKITLPEEIVDFSECILVQSTSNPANDNLMELLLLVDTLKREKINKITAIIPYLGYARQDKQHLPRECISVEMIARLLQTVGVDEVLTVDVHNDNILQKIHLQMRNLSAMQLVAKKIYSSLGLNEETEKDFTIASPDDGGISRSELFAESFYKNQANKEIVSIKKKRHLDKTHYCEAVELRGEIKDKKIILIDDVSTSGGTLLNALELCKANGIKQSYCMVVHADFAPGVAEKFQNSSFSKIFTTNTIERTVENLEFYDKIEVLDCSQIFESLI